MVMTCLPEEDHRLVTAAVTGAEQSTDGEIVTVVAQSSDAYHDVALHYSVLAMLLVPGLIAALPASFIHWAEGFFLGWNETATRGVLMLILFALLVLAFLIVGLALASVPLRMALTPGITKSRRVRRRAIKLFRTGCEQKTRGRTGVLLYVSLAEHRAEILADKAIAEQVEPEVWGEAMERLLVEVKAGRPGAGMAKAVERIGTVLADCLPKTLDNPNELPDRLIEL
jgi:putative membrane protein